MNGRHVSSERGTHKSSSQSSRGGCVCAKNASHVICWSVTLVIFLALSIFFIILLTAGQGTPSSPCQLGDGAPLRFAHRGDLTLYQENTLPAVLAARDIGLGPEVDLYPTADNEVVLFHDSSLERLTGETGNVYDRTWPELQELEISTQLGQPHVYNQTGRIPLLRDMLDALCDPNAEPAGNPSQSMYLDVKGRSIEIFPSEENLQFARQVVQILDESPCEPESHRVIIGTPVPGLASEIQTELKTRGLADGVGISYYIHPGTVPGGFHFWTKTRFLLGYLGDGASVFETHFLPFGEHADLISDLRADGYCTGVYGGDETVLAGVLEQSPQVATFDIPGTWNYDGVENTYESNTFVWGGVVAAAVLTGIVWVTSLVMLVLFIKKLRFSPTRDDRACFPCGCCFSRQHRKGPDTVEITITGMPLAENSVSYTYDYSR